MSLSPLPLAPVHPVPVSPATGSWRPRLHEGPWDGLASLQAPSSAFDVHLSQVVKTLPAQTVVSTWAAAWLHTHNPLFANGALWAKTPTSQPAGTSPGGATQAPKVQVSATSLSLQSSLAPVLVTVSSHRGARALKCTQLRSRLPAAEVTCVAGVPTTSILRTAFDISRLHHPLVAVHALDLLATSHHLDLEQLAHLIVARRRWLGATKAAAVCKLARAGVACSKESTLRMVWLSTGVAPPGANMYVQLAATQWQRLALLSPCGQVGATFAAPRLAEIRLEGTSIAVVTATAADIRSRSARAVLATRITSAYRLAADRRHHRSASWQAPRPAANPGHPGPARL